MSIVLKCAIPNQTPSSSNSIPLPQKVIWDPEKTGIYCERLSSENRVDELYLISEELKRNELSNGQVNLLIIKFNDILVEDAKACMKVASTPKHKSAKTKRTKPKKINGFEWYSKKCSEAKIRLKNLARLLQKKTGIPMLEVSTASFKKNIERQCEPPKILLRSRQLKLYNLKLTTTNFKME